MIQFSKSAALAAIAGLFLVACSGEDKSTDTATDNGDMQEQTMPETQGETAPQQGMPQMPGMQQQAPTVEVSDEELANFVQLSMDVEEMGIKAEEEMLAVLDKTGMSVERFNQLQQAEGQGQLDEMTEAGEKATYETTMEQIEEIQQRIDGEVEEKAEELGFSEDRYRDIAMAMRSDAQLMQRFQTMFMEQSAE
jgi:PBP1b-binding outer membrane lipoprotein LpoB